MNKIKVIDLLNMISKGEELPKKVVDITRGIFIESTDPLTLEYDLYNKLYEEDIYINDEVEIPEEEKKIPEKLYGIVNSREGTTEVPNNEELMFKINEIIDYLKSKGE